MIIEQSRVHLEIGSQVENIELVQRVLAESLERLQVDHDTAHSISLAVREAVANAIRHGNRERPDKRVAVDFGIEGDSVVIRVTDEGRGFDPDSVEDPRTPDNLLRPNGRGLLFMTNYMDDIDYTFQSGGGTVVTLRKKLSELSGLSRNQMRDQHKEES